MKIVIDANKIKVKHLRALQTQNIDAVIDLLAQFAQDDSGAPISAKAAQEYIDELSIGELNTMLTDLAAKLQVNPPIAAS